MHRLLVITALGAGALLPGRAAAQAAAPPPQQTPATAPGAGDIVVTAERREESAQDVGIALSVLGGDELVRRGIDTVNDLQQATPNLEIEPAFGGGAPQFRLRGVGFQDYATNNAPTVGVYVNEIAYPVPVMTQGLLFDIARVEVLRGPQGTLYGRNTTGGAISFVTNKPTRTFEGGATVEYGRFDAFRAEGYVSGPVGRDVAIRLAGETLQGGAFQYDRDTGRSLGAADRWGGRLLVQADPMPQLSALIDVHGGRDTSENRGLYLLNPLATANGTGPTIPADRDHRATGWGVSPALAADAGLAADQKPGRDNVSWGASLNARYDFGTVLLTSITSYDDLDRCEFGDWDASPSIEADTFFGSRVHVFAEEARLASQGESAFTWVGGLYYSAQALDERYFSDFLDIYGTYGRVRYDQTVSSIAGFGQADYALTRQLTLTLGLRYEHETRRLNGFGTAFGGATALPPTDVATDIDPVTGKVALEYRPVARLLLYASASRGAKSGGFTTYNTGESSAIQPFRPERLDAYEVGFKADPARWIEVNGAVYYYDYHDQQVLSAVYGANGPVGRFANVPHSRIDGAEAALDLHPLHGLTLSQYASYKSGTYLDFIDLDVPASQAAGRAIYADKSGRRIPFPHWSYGGSVTYDLALGRFDVTANSSFSYRDRYPSWLGTTYDIASYWLANAELSLAPAGGRWQATLWGRNIFDQDYDLTRNFFTSADIAQPGTPATYGFRLRVRY